MSESEGKRDSKADMGETVLLSASGEKEASEGRSASRWAAALQRLSKEDQTQFELAQNGIDDPKSVLSNVLTATNKRKEECMKKRWKLVIKGQTIIIRDILEKLSNWVQKLLAVGDVIIQYDPIHAALPWAAIKLIMQATTNDIEIFGHVLSSLENISNLIAQCQLIEVIYLIERRKQSGKLFGQLSECITDLYAAILGYLASIMHYYGLTTVVRILKSVVVSKNDMKAKYEPVESAQAKFRRFAEISGAQDLGSAINGIQGIEQHLKDKDERDQMEMQSLRDTMKDLHQPIDRIDSRLGQIQDGIEQQVRTQILKAISTIPYGVHHKTASKGRLEGSGRWLLNKSAFIDWRKKSNSSVLWLHGIPGSGKTKLASLVVDEVKGKEHMAYFYCLRNPAEPHRAQCDKILASFVRQLASLTPSDPILPPVKEHYEDAIEGFVGFEDQVWTSDECVEVLIQLVDEYPAVTFVLDALDEVDQEDRQELLDALSRILQESNSLVRVFISSRSNYDIAFYLNGTPNIYIEADDNAEDISTFIDTQLTSARLLHGKLTPSLREEITNTLQEGAKGMFRWVDLQIQSLKRVKVAADLKARLGALPDTLEGSYWEIYQEIQESGEHAFELANFTFQWLLYAQESISLEALAVLACTKSKSESGTAFSSDEVLDVCSNLIVTRQNSFDFAHLSVREFFERLHNRDIHSYQSEISHAVIAAACLRYLNLAQVENRGKALREKVMNSIKEECRVDGGPNEQKKERGENTAEKDDEPHQDEVDDNAKEADEISDEEASTGQDDQEDPEKTAKKVAKWIEKMKDDELKCLSFEIFAVVSSDDVYGQPSEYAVTWVIDHIEKSDKYRLESPLADLIKAFMLEKSSEMGDPAYKVSRSFHVWSALMSKVIENSNQKELLESAARLPSSPIWVTCQMDWLEVAEYLYECSYPGINDGRSMASLKSSFEVNPMWYAILSKKLNLIDYLTKCNADANRIFAVGAYSEPIVTAARRNDTELITILSKQNYGGQEAAAEAFISAAGEGHCESISLLLDLSLVTIDKVGHNALCSACAGGHLDAISLLLDKGAPTGRGAFMLYRAVLHQHIEVSRFLISRNIGLDGVSAALVTAVSNSDKECVDFLLQKGAQKEGVALVRAIRDKTSMTALGLIKVGYNVHGKYLQKRRSALHYAALLGQPKIVEALLEASADHGSDVLCEDFQGRIPLDLAEERDCIGAEEIIREEMEGLLQRLTAKRDTT
ncbi:hypothetical protein M431DRAFT_127355 [Trichoderma harzianum CBS 226.95]|uniref:Uncharacterized protein n=1 Tax=Trichoderma harzianum CBS 226.95 TaxID=983964 RepID=A0A2T3ZVH5_TRIHA|nr:hypothetical protein M431DRAFT_127355 [Trichoderma harzianum CBS 226.95]PTB48811.1 hypothetical protein M431DRAFT_127355 [Trichoderma harzianum CBS 226.95]